MTELASTPEPPYTVVVFASLRQPDDSGYDATMARMVELVREQPGYLGHDAVGADGRGINCSYWTDATAARAWKRVAEHAVAQATGRQQWYRDYTVRVATVERDYRMDGSSHGM